MAFRVLHDGRVEVDTAEEALRLQALLRAPIPARVTSGRHRLPRGASPGSLEGRILAVLEEQEGRVAPRVLTREVKAGAYATRKAVKALVARGVVRVEGSTGSRVIVLMKRARASRKP